jgi:oligopeptide/dipeptide ABC transporter ATP-binding protein
VYKRQALDVTIQAQILELLRELQKGEKKLSLLLITHDLGIVAEMADAVAVMYAGQIVEHGPVGEIFSRPLHPYTYLLLRSRPALGTSKTEKLPEIEGEVPPALAYPSGCRFHPRCPFRESECVSTEPALLTISPGHGARCHFAGKLDFLQWEEKCLREASA